MHDGRFSRPIRAIESPELKREHCLPPLDIVFFACTCTIPQLTPTHNTCFHAQLQGKICCIAYKNEKQNKVETTVHILFSISLSRVHSRALRSPALFFSQTRHTSRMQPRSKRLRFHAWNRLSSSGVSWSTGTSPEGPSIFFRGNSSTPAQHSSTEMQK